jgi:aspartate kinase
MSIIVQKYGGSSVADLERVGRVADRVVAAKRAGHRVCVVVSAMGKTTDQLLALARQASASPPRRELDMLLSVGERTTMALLAIALHARGEDAISFTGSQSGIITNDRHFDARIIEVRPFRIEDELARGRIVIVAGYQGMSYRREITTLGRGGSDTTAVALAAALGAARCEIYSDVDGVYSADPRVVPDARHIPAMGYEELQEMAECGAKVLNAEAVAFARREKIAIHARRTGDPVDGAGRETVVRADVPRDASGVRAVVGDHQVAWIHGEGVDFDLAERLLAAADEAQVPLRELRVDGGRASGLVPLPRVPDWERARAALASHGVSALSPGDVDAVSAVSLVGDGLTQDGRVARSALAAARDEGVTPRSITSTPFRVTLVVPAGAADALTRRLHARFCEA